MWGFARPSTPFLSTSLIELSVYCFGIHEELQKLCSLPDFIKVIKSRKKRWTALLQGERERERLK
jgi:hypothetical protein